MRLDWTALLAPLDADYVIAARFRRGTWYQLKDAGDDTVDPDARTSEGDG